MRSSQGKKKNKEITIFWPERRSFGTASNKKTMEKKVRDFCSSLRRL